MAYAGQIIRNPVSGEQIEFLRTAADTDGELLELNLSVAPDGKVPGMHVHPHQEERFEVLEGKMRFRMGLKTIEAGPGDVVTVPAGKAHKFANAGDEVAVARVQVTPALEMERLLETAVELAEEGRVMRSGMPKPLELALFVGEFKREVRGPGSPGALQRAMLAPLASIARMRGYGKRYPAAPRRNGVGVDRARPPRSHSPTGAGPQFAGPLRSGAAVACRWLAALAGLTRPSARTLVAAIDPGAAIEQESSPRRRRARRARRRPRGSRRRRIRSGRRRRSRRRVSHPGRSGCHRAGDRRRRRRRVRSAPVSRR